MRPPQQPQIAHAMATAASTTTYAADCAAWLASDATATTLADDPSLHPLELVSPASPLRDHTGTPPPQPHLTSFLLFGF